MAVIPRLLSTTHPHILGCALALLCLAVLSGCEIINPEEKTPAFIYIEEFELRATNPGQHGAVTSNITDAWVFVDDDIVGTFELPASIPILESGKHKLEIYPGLKRNGIASTRGLNPLYTSYQNDTNFLLFADSTVVVSPWCVYEPTNTYVWMEDFEDVGITLTDQGVSQLTRIDNAFGEPEYGNRVARYEINETDTLFRAITERYVMPRGLTETTIEVDYACTGSWFVAMRSFNNEGIAYQELPLLEIRSTSLEWNKIYIDLTELITQEVSAVDHAFVFTAILRPGETRDEYLFDNLKLIHQ